MGKKTDLTSDQETRAVPWWRFAFKLLRVAVMLAPAFWLSLHGALDSGAVGVFEPTGEPWRIDEWELVPFDKTQQAAHWRSFGWFQAETYSAENAQVDAFRALIQGVDGLGAGEIVIVRMPVSSDLRGWLPSEADARMRALIQEVSVGRSIRVLDMRDAVADDLFSDYAHLTPGGREVFTRKLAEGLKGDEPGGQ